MVMTETKRRSKGDGGTYQRPNGTWQATLDLGLGENGKRRKKDFYGKTEAEALRKLREFRKGLEQGTVITKKPKTFGQFVTEWLDSKRDIEPRTWESYESTLRNHTSYLYDLPLNQVSRKHIQDLLNNAENKTNGSKRGTKLSARAVDNIRTILIMVFDDAKKWQELAVNTQNPARLTRPPKQDETEVTPYTPEETAQFLSALHGHRWEAAFWIATCLGLRRGETLALRWSRDVDLDSKIPTLRVREQVQLIGGKLHISAPKTKSGKRTLVLPHVVVDVLRMRRAIQQKERESAGDRWQDNDLVFTTGNGTYILPRNFNREYDKIVSRIGLEHKPLHFLRHFNASALLQSGLGYRQLMGAMGHSRIEVTMGYAHLAPESSQEAAALMDSYMRTHVLSMMESVDENEDDSDNEGNEAA